MNLNELAYEYFACYEFDINVVLILIAICTYKSMVVVSMTETGHVVKFE